MLVIWIKLLQLWDRVLGCSLVRGTGFFSLEEGRFSVPIGQRQRSDVSRAKLFDYRTKGWIDMASRWVRGKTLALEACEALHASIAFTCLHQLRDRGIHAAGLCVRLVVGAVFSQRSCSGRWPHHVVFSERQGWCQTSKVGYVAT